MGRLKAREHVMTQRRQQIQVDAYTRFCLTAIAALLTVVVVGMWSQEVRLADRAEAAEQFGETGTNVADLLKVQRETQAKFDELISLMTSGKVKVQIVKPQEQDAGGGGENVPPPQ
jgi:threonine dehydrogenase-like Zn-dependent dehydrogenase